MLALNLQQQQLKQSNLMVQIGQSSGQKRDPMSLIKSAAPLLSDEKRQAPSRPLSGVEAAAAKDESCKWQRVSLEYTHRVCRHMMSFYIHD